MPDLQHADTVYIVSTSSLTHSPRGFVREVVDQYDASCYADVPTMNSAQIDAMVQEDWENLWTQGDDVFSTEAEAEAEAEARYDDSGRRPAVLEVTRTDVRDALLARFGPTEYWGE